MQMRNQAGGAQFLGSFTEMPPETGLPEVAFAGRSNVGKSSALNTLLGSKKAARVSRTPGRTQAINLFRIGTACAFADLPGYGFAKVPESLREAWGAMIEGYLRDREALRLVVLLVDARREAQELDKMLLDGLEDLDVPVVVVATKVDKLTRNERPHVLKALAEALDIEEVLPFSSQSGEGKDLLWDVIEEACGE